MFCYFTEIVLAKKKKQKPKPIIIVAGLSSEFLRAVQLILGDTFCVEEDECIFTEAGIPLFLRLNRVFFTRNYPGLLQRSLQRTDTL